MSETKEQNGLDRFLKDGLLVAAFVGFALTLQSAAMTKSVAVPAKPVSVASIADVTDQMTAGNTAPENDFTLAGLYASGYTSETEMSDLQNIAPAAGD